MRGRLVISVALLITALLPAAAGAHVTGPPAPSRHVSPAYRHLAVTWPAAAPVPPLPKGVVQRLVMRPFRTFARLPQPRLSTLPPVRRFVVRSLDRARQLHRIATARPEGWAAVCMNLTLREQYRQTYAAIQRELWRAGYLGTRPQIEAVMVAGTFDLLAATFTSVVPYASYVGIFEIVRGLSEGDVRSLYDLLCI